MPDKGNSIREAFFKAVFSFLGYIAHCDGPINREEVNRLKVHMKKMHLTEAEQRTALLLFKAGTAPDFNASQALQEFRAATTPKLIQILLMHLLTMARADGYLMEKELHALLWIAREVGYNSVAFNHLLKIIYEQDQLSLSRTPPNPLQASPSQPKPSPAHFSQGNGYSTGTKEQENTQPNAATNQDLQKAYAILGVNAGMTEDEMRKTYKKLASQLHPDKLMSQGLTPDQLAASNERFKQIQAAYAFIKKYRSIYSAS